MASQIDSTAPADGEPVAKADPRANLQTATDQTETLQTGNIHVGHTHLLAEIADAGAPAGKDAVDSADLVGRAPDAKPIDMQDEGLSRAGLKAYAEMGDVPTVSGGTLTLDLRSGSLFKVVPTENASSPILANLPAPSRGRSITPILKQDATEDRSFEWPAETNRAKGNPPAILSAAEATEVYALVGRDGGTTCYGFAGAKGCS